MAANCTDAGADCPCGTCPTCRQILLGTHPDVIVLEPDKDRATAAISVDRVREVVRVAGYHRYNARRRFILIDPAEALGPAAANALLKTLEEPPDGTGFILVVSNASALLPTILSRCQRIRFGAVPQPEIEAWLDSSGHPDAAQASHLAQGCPGRAIALATGGLAERIALRTRLLDVLAGRLQSVFDWSKDVVDGKRQEWSPRVEAILEIVEDLLRDVVARASGDDRPLQNRDIPDVVERWRSALWPTGVQASADAIEEARRSLAVNVSGKTVLDALLVTLKRELGPARHP
jgi:DNA polymerase III subunit delta'